MPEKSNLSTKRIDAKLKKHWKYAISTTEKSVNFWREIARFKTTATTITSSASVEAAATISKTTTSATAIP